MRSVRMSIATVIVMALAGVSVAGDRDIQDLQARLAAQEARMAEQDARMNDLHAKIASGMGGNGSDVSADNVISLRRNAKVTIGGQLVTKYTYYDVSSKRKDTGADPYVRGKLRAGDFAVSDAYLDVQIDVNDYFDAFASFDMQNGGNSDYYNAEVFFVRWKNLCNTGFGIKVGRDALVFGTDGVGELGSYAAGSGDGIGETDFGIPMHNGWDVSGVTQITPYWEGFDGKLSLELSFMQNVYEDTPYASVFETTESGEPAGLYNRGNKVRSRNYGLGTMSARVAVTPVEDLTFTLSIANYHSKGREYLVEGYFDEYGNTSKNNTVYGLAAVYRPAFFDSRLAVWGQWVHGRDVYFIDDMRSHAVNFGVSFDILENLTWFVQGDYLRTKYTGLGENQKGAAWAFYTGMQYSLAYGVSMELGWKHEKVTYKDQGTKVGKDRANIIYGLIGFEF